MQKIFLEWKNLWLYRLETIESFTKVFKIAGHQPLQDIEIRVGNSSTELQRNPLCAWFPGTIGNSAGN